jgi:hypothetical protein
MLKPLPFETLRDVAGSVTVGWAGDSAVHARVEGSMSAELGARFAGHLQTLVASSMGIHCFTDVSALTSYDLLARSAFVRFALANRRRFVSFTFLCWAAGSSQVARAFAAAIGDNVELCEDASEFEHRLTLVAPLARHRINPANWQRLDQTQRIR